MHTPDPSSENYTMIIKTAAETYAIFFKLEKDFTLSNEGIYNCDPSNIFSTLDQDKLPSTQPSVLDKIFNQMRIFWVNKTPSLNNKVTTTRPNKRSRPKDTETKISPVK